ncbi:glycosyltransferase family 2 protein [Novosphingobium aureum]|nr:glycosyltransferase family 2 protein [Novosphingobium aureum]
MLRETPERQDEANLADTREQTMPLPAQEHDARSVAVVIPCYRVSRQIADLVARIGPCCHAIYAIDDACPEHSGDALEAACDDPRLTVLRHTVNQGVGGAVMTGYRAALADGHAVVVKLDGDGQMDPALIPALVHPILAGQADYVKGNRFFMVSDVKAMPKGRIAGNLALSFLTKLSSGYWSLFDPNNGFVAIDARVLAHLPLDLIARRYFFESDMLFRLNTLRARVVDMPMRAVYGDEESSLKPLRMIPHFARRHAVNLAKRLGYSYYLRDFTLASIELPLGLLLTLFGAIFGAVTWYRNAGAGIETPTGTVMLAVLPILVGLQLLLAFIGYDTANAPSEPIGPTIGPPSR